MCVKSMAKKVRTTISIDPEILSNVKSSIGMVPLSRFLEDVLRREIAAANRGREEG